MSKVKDLTSDEFLLFRELIETKDENNQVMLTDSRNDFLLISLEFQGYIEIIDDETIEITEKGLEIIELF